MAIEKINWRFQNGVTPLDDEHLNVLLDKINELIDASIVDVEVDFSQYTAEKGYLQQGESGATWYLTAGYHVFIPIDSFRRFSVTANNDYNATYAFFAEARTAEDNLPIDNVRHTITKGTTQNIEIIDGAKYLFVQTKTSTNISMTPTSLILHK